MSSANRLGSLVQRKGEAARPVEVQQRGELAPPQPEAVQPSQSAEKKPTAKPRSLTLKLPEDQYQRLRAYGFKNDLSHQTIIETALMRYLDSENA